MSSPASVSALAHGGGRDAGDVLAFADFRLDVPGRTLTTNHGVSIPLTATEFRLLEVFVGHARRVLSREQLLDLVANRRAEPFDRSIDVMVGRLRRKIERNPAAPRLIVTSPGFGYKFTATPVVVAAHALSGAVSGAAEGVEVPSAADAGGERGSQDGGFLHSDRPSIAVLPFTNLSGDPEQGYFCQGLADDIGTELSRSRSLLVIASTTSFTFDRSVDVRKIGRELGVRYVLEGSARRVAGRVRINVQLIDARTGQHVWAKRYDRAVQDDLAVQDEIAIDIVSAILPAVADAELRRSLGKTPSTLEAWQAYHTGLRHLAQFNPADHARARQLFRYAIALDPTSAPALAALGNTHVADVLQCRRCLAVQ